MTEWKGFGRNWTSVLAVLSEHLPKRTEDRQTARVMA